MSTSAKFFTVRDSAGQDSLFYWRKSTTSEHFKPVGPIAENVFTAVREVTFLDPETNDPILKIGSEGRRMWFRWEWEKNSDSSASWTTRLRGQIVRENPSLTITRAARSYSVFDLRAYQKEKRFSSAFGPLDAGAVLYFDTQVENFDLWLEDLKKAPQSYAIRWMIQWNLLGSGIRRHEICTTRTLIPVRRLVSERLEGKGEIPDSLAGALDLPLENLTTKIAESEVKAVWEPKGADRGLEPRLEIVQGKVGRTVLGVPSPERRSSSSNLHELGFVALEAGDLAVIGEVKGADEETRIRLSLGTFGRWWADAVGALDTGYGPVLRVWIEPDAASDKTMVAFGYRYERAGTGDVERLKFQGASGCRGRLILPDFRTFDDSFLSFPVTFAVAEPAQESGKQRAVQITFESIGETGAPPQTVRAGAMEFVFGGVVTSLPDDACGEVCARLVPRKQNEPLTWKPSEGPNHTLVLEITKPLQLPVVIVRPGGQDDAGVEAVESSVWKVFATERSRPLMIPLGAEAHNNGNARYLLEIADDPRFVVRRLPQIDQGSDGTPKSLLVVDSEPFFVGLTDIPPFQAATGADTSSVIAEWTGSGPEAGYWRIRSTGDAVALTLPPQAIGEASEKDDDVGRDLDEGAPADFRLGCSGKLLIRTGYGAQRFVEPPWNLRRVLGYAGQRAPGAELDTADVEFLYGLALRFSTDFLRVAELFALLGEPPRRAPLRPAWKATDLQKKEYTTKALPAWEKDASNIRSRLALLEPWHPTRPEGLRLDESDGLKFRLRVEPSGTGPAGAQLKFPLLDGENDLNPQGYFAKADGLAGGVTWPFESPNVLGEFLRESQASSSGEISHFAFSSLGGWANQIARFNRNKTIFESRVRMGRTHYQTLERIGRIGVFWNRAKHVIVFERSVVPSAQFEEEQNKHLGRPVLRKVREYVQILQPERRYPEGGPESSPMDTGFVSACLFKSTIIPVSSAWGEDTPWGWKVPLWNPAADSAIYPRPQAGLEQVASPSASAPAYVAPFADPSHLYFFTDTTPETDDRTDLWPPRADIDFPDAPEPATPDWQPADSANPDAPLPDAPRTDSGWGAFTFDLDRSDLTADIQAGRSDARSLEATILNVSMARSSAVGTPGGAAGQVQKAISNFEHWASIVPGGLDLAAIKNDLLNRLPAFSAEVRQAAKQRADKLSLAIKDRTQGILQNAVARVQGAKTDLASRLAKAGSNLAEVEAALVDFAGWLPALTFDASKLSEEFFKKAEAALDTLLQPLVAADELAARGLAKIDELQRAATEGRANLIGQIEAPLTALRAALAGVLTSGVAIPWVDAWGSRPDIPALLRGLMTKIDAILAALVAIKASPNPAPELFDTVRTAITDFRVANANVRELIRSAFEDLKGHIREMLRGAAATAGDYLERGQTTLHGKVTAVLEAIRKKTDFQDKLGKLDQAFSQEIGDIAGKIGGWATSVESDLATVTTAFQQRGNELLTEIVAGTKTAADGIDQWLQQLQQECGSDLEAIRQTISKDAQRQIAALGDDVSFFFSKTATGATYQNLSKTLRTSRALVESLKGEGLGFNRERVALYLRQGERALGMTPCTARLKELGQDLEALGLRVPSVQLLDRVIPKFDFPNLRIDAGSILSDVGLRLEGLLPDLDMSALKPEWVTLTHGVDKQNLRAFVKAHVDAPLGGSHTLLSQCSIRVDLENPKILADVDLQADATGTLRKTGSARMSATWILSVGGVELVRFNDTAVTFKDGRMGFEISPAKVEMAGVLKVLTDLSKSIGFSSGGFSIGLPTVGDIPVGVRAALELPDLSVSAGAFSMRGLQLGAFFDIRALDDNLKFDFSLATGFHLARKDRPFTIQIFMLGGGGWVEAAVRYFPSTGRSSLDVSIGIAARAGLDINLGVASGSASVSFGAYVEFHKRQEEPGTQMVLAVFVLIEGELDILGIVSVYLALRLDIFYLKSPSGSRMFGRGTVTLKIKICWCFTLRVNKSVDFGLGEMSNSAPAAPIADVVIAENTYEEAARRYVDYVY